MKREVVAVSYQLQIGLSIVFVPPETKKAPIASCLKGKPQERYNLYNSSVQKPGVRTLNDPCICVDKSAQKVPEAQKNGSKKAQMNLTECLQLHIT